MTAQEKQHELERIAREIREFKGLDIAKSATRAVPGEGSPDTRVMFIGEAPGFHEDREGRPFVGQAGKLLEKTLKSAMGLDRSEVYITNIVKYRPPDNRDPLPAEVEACAGWLNRQITVICPEIICTLGRFSLAKFIPDVSISRVHGQPQFVNFENHRYVVFPMYHPAAALRAGSVLRDFEVDFRKLNDMLITPVGKSLPEITPDALNIQTSLF